MYTTIKDYCSNGIDNGLLLLDMPTGFGKTYNVLKYIYEASLQESLSERKFFFVTTLKKNLPKEDLEKHFKEGGHLAEFKEKFLFIDSNADCVIQNLTENLEKRIPVEIRKADEFKIMRNDVRFLRESQKNIDKKGLRPYAASIKENLIGRSEPAFRRYVQAILAREFKTVKDRVYAIRTDERWQWLGELYPAVFTSDKQIIFMSMDKFLARNATIVEPSYMFYNSKIIDNAIIFIDEFDATKETILKNIISNGLREKIDYIELFNDIYSVLHTIEFPKAMTAPSKTWTERQTTNNKYKHTNLQFVLDNIREKADAIHNQYTLQFSHKTVSNEDAESRNFLFQDHQFHAILDGNKSYITTVSDSVERINAIRFSTEKPSTEDSNIQVMLGKLRGFIKYFQGGINMLAYNYMQCRQECRSPDEDEFSFEAAIRSILAEFRLSDKHIDYITSQVLISSHKTKGDIENTDFDLSFYENGFRYYAFEDDYAHDMQSKIMMYSFQVTPEKILLRFCERAKVIGISATASVPTVVGNFDHKYLKAKMPKRYSVVADSDRQRLRTEFERSISGYNNKDITVDVQLLGEVYNEKIWEGVFDDIDLAQHIFEKVERAQSQEKNNYNKERYYRIAMAYKQFVCHDDIQSFLCVLTKHPRPGDMYLDMDLIHEIFKYIHKEHGQKFDKNTVCLLDGEEFDSNKEQIIGRLQNGEKLFVISVYQTIGAGQNLQYGIPQNLSGHLATSNERASRGEKDFDAIYLDKPTNIFVNLNENISDEDFVKYLYYVEFLQESAELSAQETRKHVKKAFKTFLTGHPYWDDAKSVYDIKSVVLMSTRTIIQAIGRICRTNQKRKKVYVFADYRIAESIDFDIDDGKRLLNPEFKSLLSHIKEQKKTYDCGNFVDEASLLSVRVNKMINNILREDWTDSRMAQWKMLREYTLQFPTLSSSKESSSFLAHNTYVRLPKPMSTIYYSQELDYNKVLVSFVKTKDYPYEVSSSAAKLDLLMKNQNLKTFFERKGWATSFAYNDFILSPPLFNNIYKGALGEMSGRFLLWDYLGLNLTEIDDPEIFELFDYKIENTDIYIDFKNWHERTRFDNLEMLKKIQSKSDSCKAKCVIVINVVSEQFTDPIRTNYGDLTVVQIPSLIYSNDPNKPIHKALDEIKRCLDEFAD